MQLVGAPQAYIRGPFVMEGVLQGGIGALVALVALAAAFFALRARYLVAAGVGAQPVVDPVPAARALRAAGRRRDGGRLPRRAGRGVGPAERSLQNLDTSFCGGTTLDSVTRQFTLEDLHATLRDRFEADQRAAPAHRVLPRRIRQTSPLSAAAAALLFRERHHRRRSRARHGSWASSNSSPRKTTPPRSSAPSSRNSTS